MHGAPEFLQSLAVVFCVAGVTTVVFQKLRQPVIFGYLVAGMIVGPHIPIPLVADPDIVQTLSELGVILLMFFLGLEFSLTKLLRVGPTAGVVALVESSFMIWLGYEAGTAVRLAAPGELLRRSGPRHLQHDDHRLGLQGAGNQGEVHRDRLRDPDLRGPDRDPPDGGPHHRLRRDRLDRPGTRLDGGPSRRLPGRPPARRDADRSPPGPGRLPPEPAARRRSWRPWGSVSPAPCWPACSGIPWPWAPSSRARWSPSRGWQDRSNGS